MTLITKPLGRTDACIVGTVVASADTLVTNTTGIDTRVAAVHLYNSHSAAIRAHICVVLAGATPDIYDEIWNQSIAAYDTEIFDVPIPLNTTNDKICVYAGTTGKINAFAYGGTFTDDEGIAKALGRTDACITQTAVATADTIVTNTANIDTTVTQVVFHNTHSAAIRAYLCVVLAGATPDAYDVIWAPEIAAYDTEVYDVNIQLNTTNDKIRAYADTGDKVNVFAYGYTQADQE